MGVKVRKIEMGCRARMVGGPLHTEPFTIQSLQPGGQGQLEVVGRFEWLAKVKGRLKPVFGLTT